jgi:hypothetical protein
MLKSRELVGWHISRMSNLSCLASSQNWGSSTFKWVGALSCCMKIGLCTSYIGHFALIDGNIIFIMKSLMTSHVTDWIGLITSSPHNQEGLSLTPCSTVTSGKQPILLNLIPWWCSKGKKKCWRLNLELNKGIEEPVEATSGWRREWLASSPCSLVALPPPRGHDLLLRCGIRHDTGSRGGGKGAGCGKQWWHKGTGSGRCNGGQGSKFGVETMVVRVRAAVRWARSEELEVLDESTPPPLRSQAPLLRHLVPFLSDYRISRWSGRDVYAMVDPSQGRKTGTRLGKETGSRGGNDRRMKVMMCGGSRGREVCGWRGVDPGRRGAATQDRGGGKRASTREGPTCRRGDGSPYCHPIPSMFNSLLTPFIHMLFGRQGSAEINWLISEKCKLWTQVLSTGSTKNAFKSSPIKSIHHQ